MELDHALRLTRPVHRYYASLGNKALECSRSSNCADDGFGGHAALLSRPSPVCNSWLPRNDSNIAFENQNLATYRLVDGGMAR